MKSALAEERFKELVFAAVDKAFEQHKTSLQNAIIEAIEDIGLGRAMDEADRKLISADRIDRLLKRGSED